MLRAALAGLLAATMLATVGAWSGFGFHGRHIGLRSTAPVATPCPPGTVDAGGGWCMGSGTAQPAPGGFGFGNGGGGTVTPAPGSGTASPNPGGIR